MPNHSTFPHLLAKTHIISYVLMIFFKFYYENICRCRFFTYLCIRNNLELFKIINYKTIKGYYYDKEIQMLGLRLYS